jgi:nickel/cobalt transporter (NicO) family protein
MIQKAATPLTPIGNILRNKPAKLAMIALQLALVVLPAKIASAHPLGNFTLNRYSRLEVEHNKITLIYIVDRAEIPAFQEREAIDTDKDGQLSNNEQQAYLKAEIARLQANLKLVVDGAPVALQPESNQIEFPAGQGGLLTQRITARFVAPITHYPLPITYSDTNFAGRLGWQEIVLKAGPNVTLQGNDLPTTDISHELRNYPQDMLQSPVQRSAVSFQLSAISDKRLAVSDKPAAINSTLVARTSADPFADLIQIKELTVSGVLLAVLGAFVWGAAHALSPGHGKTIVAAYVIGQRATLKHAIFLGATTTITHTAGVFALGLITLFASQFILPETLYPWLEVISGVLVVVLGATLLRGRVLGLLGRNKVPGTSEVPGTSNASHADFDPAQPHDHGDGFTHKHVLPGQKVSWRSLLALGVSGGLLPCPSALVVMLSAIALNRVGFGILLIVVFSLGLASVLIAIGMLLVRAGKLMNSATRIASLSRFKFTVPLIRAAPVFSALVITLAGLGITWRALALAGVIRI